MSNIHLRELPPMTLEILKTAAAANGRSLNAELVRLLTEEAEHIQRTRHPLPAHRQQRPNGGTILPTVAF
jgi:plasmid stability protein